MPTLALAQPGTGSLAGTIKDPSGAVVSNATVTATNVNTHLTRTAATSGTGGYNFTALPPGTYEVQATAQGFAPVKQQVDVSVGAAATADLQMNVASAGTTVVVEGAAPETVNTENQQVSSVVTSQQIAQLPTITRNPYDLVALSGNVQQDTQAGMGDGRGVGYSINGQRSASTDVMLDGGENVNAFTATVGQTVPQDSVQEYRVVTNGMTAQYGRASGGVVDVVTKSGTNDWHGSVYEFNRISALASNTYFNVANGVDKPVFTRNQFGFSVGGPIVHDKLFFFTNTEWLRVRSPAAQITLVPDPASIAASSPQTQAFFSTYGKLRPDIRMLGTVTGPGGFLLDKVTYNAPNDAGGGLPQNATSFVGRIDYNMTDKTMLFGRYALHDETDEPGTINTSPYQGFETGQTLFDQNAVLSITHLFSSNTVSNTRFVINRLNDVQPLGAAPVGPTLYITNSSAARVGSTRVALPGYNEYTPGSAIPFGGPQNVAQVLEDVSWSHGNHTFRFGGAFIYTQDNRAFGAYQEAVEALATSDPGVGFDNLRAGQLELFQGAVFPQGKFPCPVDLASGNPIVSPSCQVTLPVGPPSFSRSNRYRDAALYGQDTWKVTPRLNLDLGLRWEYYGVQHNVNPNLDSNFYLGSGSNMFTQIRNGSVQVAPRSPIGGLWNTNPANFGPRIGFAYDLFGNGTTALRGGYGISYERMFNNVSFNVIQNPPNYAVLSLEPADVGGTIPVTTSNAGPLAGSGGTATLSPTSLRAVDPHLKIAYAHQWNLTLERQLGAGGAVVDLTYNGSRGIHQYSISNVNDLGYAPLFLGDTANLRLNPQYTPINWRASQGDSYFHGLTAQLRGRVLQQAVNVSYTWSHTIDTLSSAFSDEVVNNGLGYLDPFHPGLDRASADYDARHRISATLLLEEPFFKNSGKLLRNTLGGFQLAPIFTFHTGYPFTVFDCTNSIAAYNCPRADVAGPVPVTGSPGSDLGGDLFNYLSVPVFPGQYAGPANIPGTNTPMPITGSNLPTCTGLMGVGCSFPSNMLRRNSFRAPSVWNWDLGVYKNFKLTERVTLQARAEFFDILNHKNFYVVGFPLGGADVSTLAGSPACAAGPCSFNAQVMKGGYGNPFDDHRNTQLAIRLTF
ncbi:MAG TPA: TonB-dependent receptor [Terriglobales bacterium]|nr:TonB-dependent receptor [Terriglobales bacterium]